MVKHDLYIQYTKNLFKMNNYVEGHFNNNMII